MPKGWSIAVIRRSAKLINTPTAMCMLNRLVISNIKVFFIQSAFSNQFAFCAAYIVLGMQPKKIIMYTGGMVSLTGMESMAPVMLPSVACRVCFRMMMRFFFSFRSISLYIFVHPTLFPLRCQ